MAAETTRQTAKKWVCGTYSRYTCGKCRCPDCSKAAALYAKQRVLLIERGEWKPFVDAEPVREHVAGLLAAGVGRETIADLSGVANTTITSLMYDGRPQIRAGVAEKLMAVRPTLDDLPDWGKVDATGSRRRIQALMFAGWSQAVLAERLGVDRSMILKLMARPTVRVYNARAIRDLFSRLWMQAPPEVGRYERAAASRARAFALRNGWVSALAWDDIDDPDAVPSLGEDPTRLDLIVELADRLAATKGLTHSQAAERLGVRPGYLSYARSQVRSQAVGA